MSKAVSSRHRSGTDLDTEDEADESEDKGRPTAAAQKGKEGEPQVVLGTGSCPGNELWLLLLQRIHKGGVHN